MEILEVDTRQGCVNIGEFRILVMGAQCKVLLMKLLGREEEGNWPRECVSCAKVDGWPPHPSW